MTQREIIQTVIDHTQPLRFSRAGLLPIFVSRLESVGGADDKETLHILEELNARGIAMNSQWNPDHFKESCNEAIRVGKLQRRLGLMVSVDASACMYSFFNGDENTFHVDKDGKPFYDDSFAPNRKMGCSFALRDRYEPIRQRFIPFLEAYKAAGLDVDFIYLDWEIDGPIEWNGAWEASKRCTRCRKNIPDIDTNFAHFQAKLRQIRADMQREVFVKTVQQYFPHALIGNYGVYPNDGKRYWYDYYEQEPANEPFTQEQNARYRPWYQEFPETGYTFAMGVVYAWYPIFHYYNFRNTDYRWFYNMLKVATNVCQHTPPSTPIVSYVHWSITAPPKEGIAPDVKPLNELYYRELLWHMLLRGNDAFFMWCPANEVAKEIAPVQEVYAEALQYYRFLKFGEPVCFDVPSQPGAVVSGLRVGNEVLVRRTDFGNVQEPVLLTWNGSTVRVPKFPWKCQILHLP